MVEATLKSVLQKRLANLDLSQTGRRFMSKAPSIAIFILVLLALVSTARSQGPAKEDCGFCGTWEYIEKNYPGDTGRKKYLKIAKAGTGKFRLSLGFEYQGRINWATDAINVKGSDGIYLRPVNRSLVARFVSSNFQATHGMEFTYRVTCTLQANSKMLYSVWSSIRGETEKHQATRTGN